MFDFMIYGIRAWLDDDQQSPDGAYPGLGEPQQYLDNN